MRAAMDACTYALLRFIAPVEGATEVSRELGEDGIMRVTMRVQICPVLSSLSLAVGFENPSETDRP